MRNKVSWFIPTLIFAILVILGAYMHPLWGDEAETALFARSILRHGVPYGWDGVNIMGINNAVVLNKALINHTSPWGQYYLTAFSFLLFGQTSFTARIPFIILSILSLPLLYFATSKVFEVKRISLLVLWIVALSAPFILFAYQARYYSITLVAGLLFFTATHALLQKRILPKLLFVISGTLFFYGNYVSFVAFYSANFFSFLLFLLISKKPWKQIVNFIFLYLFLSVGIVALTLPWYLMLEPFEGRGAINIILIREFLGYIVSLFQEAISPYNTNNAFPILFFPLALMILLWQRKRAILAPFFLVLALPLIYLMIMTFFTVIAVVDTAFIHSRYTMVIFPFFSISAAFIIGTVWGWKREIAFLIFALFVLTNLFTLQRPRSMLWEFIQEIAHPYETPDKAVADYLITYAKNGDTAFVTQDRDHEPLIFHLGDKIRFVNRISITNSRVFPENRRIIPRYIYAFVELPDWIILYSKRGIDNSFLTFDYRQIPFYIDLENDYEEIVIPVFFSDMSRPEIELRSFQKIDPAPKDQVFLFKKK